MREYLFRAKRSKEFESAPQKVSEWVEGMLEAYQGSFSQAWIGTGGFSSCMTACDPETVGEYTGLTDEKGTKVFEGDIVQLPALVSARYSKFIVVWEKYSARFMLHEIKHPGIVFDMKIIEDVGGVVIGNIIDNPEMLK